MDEDFLKDYTEVIPTKEEMTAIHFLATHKEMDVFMRLLARHLVSKGVLLLEIPSASQDFELAKNQGMMALYKYIVKTLNQ